MSLHTMQDLLVTQLRELHASERRSDEVLPRLADGAADRELARFFQRHAEDARERARRLERVLDRIGAPAADGTELHGFEGLCDDCLALARQPDAEPHVRDAALVAVAQHVEHDRIAGYGCARTWTTLLGHEDAAALLQESLDETRRADGELNDLAESIHRAAPLEPMNPAATDPGPTS